MLIILLESATIVDQNSWQQIKSALICIQFSLRGRSNRQNTLRLDTTSAFTAAFAEERFVYRNFAVSESSDVGLSTQCFFIGWDVGAWHCDNNPNSRDTLSILDKNGEPIGRYWRNNLKSLINSASSTAELVRRLLSLCDVMPTGRPFVTIAIDTPLGFPKAFADLLLKRRFSVVPEDFRENPYLFRETERLIGAREPRFPLSAVKDQIGSQATKGMHFCSKFAPIIESTGVWTDGVCLRAIETYPTPVRRNPIVEGIVKRFPVLPADKARAHADIEDSRCCAAIAYMFESQAHDLFHPYDSISQDEGWIWVPN